MRSRLCRACGARPAGPMPADWWVVSGGLVCPACWHRRLGELRRLRRELEQLTAWIASGNREKLARLVEQGLLPASAALDLDPERTIKEE